MLPMDPVTRRLIQPDAESALTKFRESGSQPFHMLDINTLRETYERNCRLNGFPNRSVAEVQDYRVANTTTRIYEPVIARAEPTPVILFAHGGGWVMGSLDTHDSLCRELAARTGYPVVAVGYRLAPEHRFPAAYDDVADVLQCVSKNELPGIHQAGIILAGDSAGGQIVASLAVRESQILNSPVLGQVLFYPVTDVSALSPVHGIFTQGLPLVDDTMRWFIDSYVAPTTELTDPRLSPARGDIGPYCCPAFVVSVDIDPLAGDGGTYVQTLIRAGAEIRFRHLRGVPHGIFTSGRMYKVADEIVKEAAAFIINLDASA